VIRAVLFQGHCIVLLSSAAKPSPELRLAALQRSTDVACLGDPRDKEHQTGGTRNSLVFFVKSCWKRDELWQLPVREIAWRQSQRAIRVVSIIRADAVMLDGVSERMIVPRIREHVSGIVSLG
jgi:hypothetical protein